MNIVDCDGTKRFWLHPFIVLFRQSLQGHLDQIHLLLPIFQADAQLYTSVQVNAWILRVEYLKSEIK